METTLGGEAPPQPHIRPHFPVPDTGWNSAGAHATFQVGSSLHWDIPLLVKLLPVAQWGKKANCGAAPSTPPESAALLDAKPGLGALRGG